MKNLLIFIYPLLLLSSNIRAQDFEAGIVAGVNAAQINGDMMGGFNKTSINIGLLVKRKISEKVGMQMEMLYSRKGSRRIFNDEFIQDGPWDKARANYIEVPLLVNYHYKKWLIFQAGLSAGYLINSRINYGVGFIDVDFLKNKEFAYMGGAEIKVSKKLSINSRFSQSLISLTPGNPNPVFSRFSGYINMLVTFSARIALGE
jgi:hypothetical protein